MGSAKSSVFVSSLNQLSSTGTAVTLGHVLNPAVVEGNVCSLKSESHCPYPRAWKLIQIAPFISLLQFFPTSTYMVPHFHSSVPKITMIGKRRNRLETFIQLLCASRQLAAVNCISSPSPLCLDVTFILRRERLHAVRGGNDRVSHLTLLQRALAAFRAPSETAWGAGGFISRVWFFANQRHSPSI